MSGEDQLWADAAPEDGGNDTGWAEEEDEDPFVWWPRTEGESTLR